MLRITFKPVLVGLEYEIHDFTESELDKLTKWMTYAMCGDKELIKHNIILCDVHHRDSRIDIEFTRVNGTDIDVGEMLHYIFSNGNFCMPTEVLYNHEFGDKDFALWACTSDVDIVKN